MANYTAEDADLEGIPDDVDLSKVEDQLYKESYKRRESVILQHDGWIGLMHQRGVELFQTDLKELVVIGDSVVHAVVSAALKWEGGDKTYVAYGDRDSTTADDKVVSYAETAAEKRVIRKALGIRITSRQPGGKSQSKKKQGDEGSGASKSEKPKPNPGGGGLEF